MASIVVVAKEGLAVQVRRPRSGPHVARLKIVRVDHLILFTEVVALAAIDRQVAWQARESFVLSSGGPPPHIGTGRSSAAAFGVRSPVRFPWLGRLSLHLRSRSPARPGSASGPCC